MITVNEYVLNKIETSVLCDDREIYSIKEIHEMIANSIDDFDYEYNTTSTNSPNNFFEEVTTMLNKMNITVLN